MILSFQKNDDCVIVKTSKDVSKEYFDDVISNFLSLDDDYEKINENIFSHFGKYNDVIYSAYSVSKGIRILKQDFFETLISFIISQNNNIPRIKKIISSLCSNYGKQFEFDGQNYYSFPECKDLISLNDEDLMKCGCGFRWKYILDACQKYSNKTINYDELIEMPYDEQLSSLKQICGVGDKVANCVILFSLHNLSAFPIDVWIKKVIEKYYSNNLDLNNLGLYAGVAQQYLFYYEKYQKGEIGNVQFQR